MMSTQPLSQKPAVPFMTYVLTLGAPLIGFIGASMVLPSKYIDSLAYLLEPGTFLMALGPWLTSPGMIRSAWANKQPSWLAFGVSTLIVWPAIFMNPEAIWPRATLIFMVGFLFMGLSNIVMDQEKGTENRTFDWEGLKSPAKIPLLAGFIVQDVALTVKIGIEGIIQVLSWPIKALSGNVAVPQVLSPNSLWRSRRFGGFFFTLAGLFGLAGSFIPQFQNIGHTLFDMLGLTSSLIVNYSLFFTGVRGKHWLTKLLIPGTLLATAGAAFRTQTFGFALDQFGSRLNEMYMCGIPLIGDDDDVAEEPIAVDAVHHEHSHPETNAPVA